MSHAPLVIEHVSKSFAPKSVLEDVGFTMKEGEILGLIGLNGIGKTTLIKIILGLLKPDSGSTAILGRPSHLAEARRHLWYLPEKFMPSPYLKGREFIDLALSYHGLGKSTAEIEEKALDLDLDPAYLSRRIGKYSKGMGQKVGLIATLLSEAPLLILDEPMSGLDPKSRILLKRQLSVHKAKGRSVFFSSHILSDLEEICDRIAVLHDRRLIYIGTPQQFVSQYNPAGGLEKAFLRAIMPGVQEAAA